MNANMLSEGPSPGQITRERPGNIIRVHIQVVSGSPTVEVRTSRRHESSFLRQCAILIAGYLSLKTLTALLSVADMRKLALYSLIFVRRLDEVKEETK